MNLVACVIAQAVGEPVKFRLKDADTGIVYPNLLNTEQIRSPSVHEAARTYIGMKTPESIAPTGFTTALIDEINQLKRALAGLQERNDRQARIIAAVQGAVRGDVQ